MTGRNYGFMELIALLKWFEILRAFLSREQWRHNDEDTMNVTSMCSSINQPKFASLRLKLSKLQTPYQSPEKCSFTEPP